MIEMQKLREGRSTSETSAVQGRLTISDIKLPLKSEFLSKIGSVHGQQLPVFLRDLKKIFLILILL